MPKLVDDTGDPSEWVKIDGQPFPKNSLTYQVNGNEVCVWIVSSLETIACATYNQWTDSADSAYASVSALTNDMDDFFYTIPGGLL